MSACLPLSDSLRIGFQFHQSLTAQHGNYPYNPQQRSYPRVYLLREYPRGFSGPVPLETIGRAHLFDMSWEEYCNLVQSKPLAMNILTFRDLTGAPNDITRSQRPIQMYNQPSPFFLPHFNSGITQLNAMATPNPIFPTNPVVNNNVNFGYSAHNALQRPRDYSSQNTNGSNHFMSRSSLWCNKSCCVPSTSTYSTFGSAATSQSTASSFAGADRDINRSSVWGANPTTFNPTAQVNLPDNLSTIAGGRSSASSGIPYCRTENLLPSEQRFETESGQNDTNSDDNIRDYDFNSEATGDEFQTSEDEVQAENQTNTALSASNTSTASTMNNLSEPVRSFLHAITSTTSN